MTREAFLRAIRQLKVWKQGDRRAPHKPLLLLYALGRFARGAETRLRFAEVEGGLTPLFQDFGPANPTTALYPFNRLRTSGLWDPGIPDSLLGPGGDPRKTDLLARDVAGGFTPEVIELLSRDPDLIRIAAEELVTAHFPPSLQDDILSAVGLDRDLEPARRRGRDPAFREAVLAAYEFSCAACNYDLALGRSRVGLEAAHIKWVQANGPDAPDNGLGLCILHHKLLDLGAWRLDDDLHILVSDQVHGRSTSARALLDLHGERLRTPVHPEMTPNPAYIAWHGREVFKGRARPLVA